MLHCRGGSGGAKNVILQMVHLNGFYTKSFDKNLKPGIPCPVKCLAYNNIVFLNGSGKAYDIECSDNNWRAEYGYFSN